MKNKIALLSIAMVVSSGAMAVPSQYSIIDLGMPGGGNSVYAWGLNESGQVVGRVWMLDNTSKAFKWTNNSFSLVSPLSGGTYAIANAINDAGVVVGERYGLGFAQGFYWKPNQSIQSINNYGQSNAFNSYARDINNSGVVTGYANGITGGSSPYRAFIFDTMAQSPVLDELGTFSSGSSTYGQGINDSGTVTGANQDTGANMRAFKKTTASPMQNLGAYGVLFNSYDTYGIDINNNGGVAAQYYNGNSVWRPLYKSNSSAPGVYVDVPVLPGTLSSDHVYPTAINSDADIVGINYINGVGRAFLFETLRGGTQTVDLNSKISAGLGWTLNAATDINDKGWIVGYGIKNGQTRSFLMKPTTKVSGKVTLQGYGGNPMRWIQIEIRDNATNALLETQFLQIDEFGNYNFETDKVGTRKLLFICNAPFLSVAKTSVNMNNNISNVNVTAPNGDIDGDNAVTPADYGIWQLNNGSFPSPGENGDLDGDGAVTPSDYGIWAQNNGLLGDD